MKWLCKRLWKILWKPIEIFDSHDKINAKGGAVMDASNLARYIVTKCTKENAPISNLQLQKILYYIQKAFLKQHMVAFFDDIEAWQFGPVVPTVYYLYCGFGASPIRMIYADINSPELSDRQTVDTIVEEKRELSPWDMVEDTHKQNGAWDQIYRSGKGNHQVIPRELIAKAG